MKITKKYLWRLTGLVVVFLLLVSQYAISQNRVIRSIPSTASQGVAVDKNYYYAISDLQITKYDKTTDKLITTWRADLSYKAFEHLMHMNSGTVVDGKLYVAHSRYSVDPNFNTVEIWNVERDRLEHEKTIRMPRKYGSLTWIDKDFNGSWWMCYAVYGEDVNRKTRLVKYRCEDMMYVELDNWYFPDEAVENWGDMSCSGGSWGPDGFLYTTGHDYAKAFVLEIDNSNKLKYLRTENNVGFYGQAISWDRFTKPSTLWGIVKRKYITATVISGI